MYFFIICFFFFKQKTAYEMRISDWSSDVCSSDLVYYFTEKGHTRTATATFGVIPRVLLSDAKNTSKSVFAQFDYHILDTLTFTAGEIGRASCRERVCQYV